ncbi:MAG: flagellar biosynthesis protein FlhF [Treponema sp.]|nr:flagellar biosynthesis protein FlhF [Treponema sp.]
MGLDILVERGTNKGDCVHKIVKKYGIYFTILREKTVPASGLFGMFKKEEVEVEFYLSPQIGLQGSVPPPQTVQSRDRQFSVVPTAMPMAVSAAMPSQRTMPGDGTTLDFEEAKKKVLAAARRDPEKVIREVTTLSRQQDDMENSHREILDELKEIRESLKSQGDRKTEHPTLLRLEEILRLNDFSERYTTGLLERARKELSLETLENFEKAQNRLLEWIGESVGIYQIPEKPPRKPGDGHSARIMVVVGPTGVGKTTTVSKLAAIYGIGNVSRPEPLSVRIVTIDAFRIGAQHQIEGYAKIMEIPVSFIDNHRDLQREIDLHREVADLILVDTIGRSPRDSAKLGEMKQILDACGPKAEVHLAISASVKTDDLLHIMRQFEPFDYGAVLLTKLDETRHVGNVIRARGKGQARVVHYRRAGRSQGHKESERYSVPYQS